MELENAYAEDRSLGTPVVATFQDLLKQLRLQDYSNSEITDSIRKLLLLYQSNPEEWMQYAKFGKHTYTRNLVEANGRYNILLLAWREGQGSKIHDHANSNCFVKVLSGRLREIRYTRPEKSEGLKEMKETSDIYLDTNNVAYMNDELGVHLMENTDTTPAVSMHVYTPPFDIVSLFDPRTGQTTQGQMTYHSKFGEMTPTGASSGN